LGYGLDYAHQRQVGRANEDPRVALAAPSSDHDYVVKGKALSPWRFQLDSSIVERSVDLGAQEDARQFSWTDAGALAIQGPSINLMRQLDEGFVLSLEWRIDALSARPVQIALGGGVLSAASLLRDSPVGRISRIQIPLRCFRDVGADLKSVDSPIQISGGKGLTLTLRDARIEPVGNAIACPASN
jgi:beta-glucosidase